MKDGHYVFTALYTAFGYRGTLQARKCPQQNLKNWEAAQLQRSGSRVCGLSSQMVAMVAQLATGSW